MSRCHADVLHAQASYLENDVIPTRSGIACGMINTPVHDISKPSRPSDPHIVDGMANAPIPKQLCRYGTRNHSFEQCRITNPSEQLSTGARCWSVRQR